MNAYADLQTELGSELPSEVRLRRLHRWLTLETLSAGLGTGAFFLPYGLIFAALVVAAVAFSPYMLWQLYQCRKFGWIKAFLIVVGMPLVIAVVIAAGGVAGFLLLMLPLFSFYAFTLILRHAVGGWIEEAHWSRVQAVAMH